MSDIKKINVNGTLYDVAGGGGVVANPELEGDEPVLTGLEVDGTKYKVSQGGSGDRVINLANYFIEYAATNGKAIISREDVYKLDIEDLINYIQEMGIGDLPFEPNLEGTEQSGCTLMSSGTTSESLRNIALRFYTKSTDSEGEMLIDMFDVNLTIENLINLEGDTFIDFLNRNKNAIKEELDEVTFGGSDIYDELENLYSYSGICTSVFWHMATTSPVYVNSMDLFKFLELFKLA